MMYTHDFNYELPESLIAQSPSAERRGARLLYYDGNKASYEHHTFAKLAELLKPGDLLVLNNSKVVPARLSGSKTTGGRVSFLLERKTDENTAWFHAKASKPLRPGQIIELNDKWTLTIQQAENGLYQALANGPLDTILKEIGETPLPPYITRTEEASDVARYQTVYARHDGSVAAPTAGLHFDEPLLATLTARGIEMAHVTLHVGAGTFQPVRAATLAEHRMHAEWCEVDEAVCEQVNRAKRENRRVIAVGTTAMRSLETAAVDGVLNPYCGETRLFIYPGYTFQICRGLLTNFHVPQSSLLMLVAAFIGHPEVMALYQEAIGQKYRFFSYGDTSLLFPREA